MREICIAHSPDADDLFMYYAIVFGWVDTPCAFKNIALDIQTLNALALQKFYAVSAISFGVYPLIAQDYALLRTGLSFGKGYGPKLIKKKDKILKKHFKVALSGEHTTNALLFRLKYPQARIIYKNFLDIETAVLSGEVDAGVLIHESILNFDASLSVEAHLWDIWLDLTKKELPLPLGGMAISRSIPLIQAIAIEESLTKAVKIATTQKQILSKMLLDRHLVRVNSKDLETYLNLYANTDSISLNQTQLRGIEKLFELGYEGGFYPHKIDPLDCLIPSEYKQVRYN
ncbi:menaquinone biosynthesis family protein [Helicobacter kayseriensis]|uniref:menaquinone biosynthesis family protein n=1 Tax=Helicobacter kayseriensis TaxID=2905877 RepID=UPI001E4ED4CC|nr:MqnA/MqnD/SBP family protein [Helicobacter kayseriensis]MCE3047350.1 S-ribosylhomocysteine lyase [Helicobacter kayseriensis]MCE3048721.1 S-ribosylhomocysteine lyase [Helicobacter kayseriensis]